MPLSQAKNASSISVSMLCGVNLWPASREKISLVDGRSSRFKPRDILLARLDALREVALTEQEMPSLGAGLEVRLRVSVFDVLARGTETGLRH